MTYLIINVFLLVTVSAVGRLILLKVEGQKNWSGAEPIVGYSVLIIYYSIYFIIETKIAILTIIFLPVIIFSVYTIVNYRVNIFFKKRIFILIAVFLPNILFLLLFEIYGNNFTVFRGNIWDAFNYNTMAVAYSKYKHTEFDQIINSGSAIGYIAKQNITQRPSVVLIPAIALSFFSVDNFNLMFFYKAFLLSLYICSIFYLSQILKINKSNSIILALTFTFSSWIFYVVEIDALSNLAFLPFVPIFAAYMFNSNRLELSGRPVFFMIMASSFIIYPEFGSIILLALFISISKSICGNKNIDIKKIVICLTIFFAIIYAFRAQTIYFLVRQISGAAATNADWWGYFGGYLLGPFSPVTDPEFVLALKATIASGEGLIGEILKLLVEYILNILPSIFGLFHLLSIDWLVIPSNLIACIILVILIKWFLKKNNDDEWIRLSIFILASIILIFFMKGSYWSAIKGLSWILTILPIVLTICFSSLKNKQFKFITILSLSIIPMFVPYKYQIYNYGIGMYDGFPSVLNKVTKIDNDWNFDRSQILNCKNILIETSNPFKRHYYFLQLENLGIKYSSSYPILESYGVGRVISHLKDIKEVDCKL